MIRHIRLLRNIGQFDSMDAAATIDLKRLVLIYAENGRGKTTLAAALRSLATGDPTPITERRRLAVAHPPHVVLDCEGDPPTAIFKDGNWNCGPQRLALFDDVFVDGNIHSGLVVDTDHRKNLHELVLGAQGVDLSRKIQNLVARIEAHNSALREKKAAVPEEIRYGFPVDDFCALPKLQGLDEKIEATERVLAAAREQDAVRTSHVFEALVLPAFDADAMDRILKQALSDLDATTEAQVRDHIAKLQVGGEQWLADGMRHLSQQDTDETCPFCAQALTGLTLIAHYRAYFSAAYRDLKKAVAELLDSVRRTHSGDVQTKFERAVRVAGELRAFWSRFCDVPEVHVDTADVVCKWNAAQEAAMAALKTKQAAPLERYTLEQNARHAIAEYDALRRKISSFSDALIAANDAIRTVQKQAAGANLEMIKQELARLRGTKNRHTPETAALCTAYLEEKKVKARTEKERAQARRTLDEYRDNAFPESQRAINDYLRRFNASFKLDSVTSTSTRGGPTCNYNIVINTTPIAVGGGTPEQREPSFRNTLSSGDRNTLALAFFFSSLKQDPDLATAVVVIDDPVSSLDDHRSQATVQEIRELSERVGQVIVLSHDKRFLCRIWSHADKARGTALEIVRDGNGSTICPWDVGQDSVTEHDRRHLRLREFVDQGTGDPQKIARDIRPHLEAFLRVAHPQHFPPGTALGRLIGQCRQKLGKPEEILDCAATRELRELTEYANRFHHDADPAWETEVGNDHELAGFVRRALDFARR